MRIVVVGTIVADTIEHPDGSVTESLGGIAHTVAVLSALGGEQHDIVPVCRVGEDCRRRVVGWAAGLAGVDLAAVRWMAADNPRVRLSYGAAARDGERVERLIGAISPLHPADVHRALAAGRADLALVNCITGSDCTPAALAALRAAAPRLYLDLHSLTLGTGADGTRFERQRDDWDEWLAHADVVQCNLNEAAVVCGLPAGERPAGELLAAVARGLEARLRRRPHGDGGAPPRPLAWALTLGAGGASLLERRRDRITHQRVAAPAITAVDPTGAGDAFAAGYALAWLAGASFAAATRAGVRCGSAACLVAGSPAAAAFRRGWQHSEPPA